MKHTRVAEGAAYQVRLPFRMPNKNEEEPNYNIVFSRFRKLEADMQKNSKMRQEYQKAMADEFENGFLREIDSRNVKAVIPHHGVFKEMSTSTKLRVIRDLLLIFLI